MKIMPKKIRSNGNRRPIRYGNWNRAIAIWYDGNILLKLVLISSFKNSFIMAVGKYT